MYKSTLVILPAHNEAFAIGDVITAIRKVGLKKIVVIDDGSNDETGAIAYKMKAIVRSHTTNRGKGVALRTGFRYALLQQTKYVVTIDADGQHDPRDLPRLIRALDKGYDVALGNRFGRHNHVPLYARIGNVIGNVASYAFAHIWVHDSQCGIRAYKKEVIQKLRLHSTKYEIDTELIREIQRLGVRYAEVPVRVHYTRYSRSKRTRQSLRNSVEMLRRLWHLYHK